ncbi:MAG: hypothetical protein ACXWFC_13170 [Nitrososphaeraceae archaeon]
MTREGRIKDWYFINWQNLYHFFITITLALLSKSNGKKEVIEKIQKWLNEESIYFTMEEAPYLHIQNLDFQINIKKPIKVFIPIKISLILLNLEPMLV